PTVAQLQGDFSRTFNSAGQMVVIANPFAVNGATTSSPSRVPFPGNIIPPSMFDPVSNAERQNQKIWALPNAPGDPPTGVSNFSTSAVQPNNEDQVVTRMDHSIGSKYKIFGTYASQWITLGGFDPFRNGTDFLTVGGNESDLAQTGVVGVTALFSPHLVGEFRSSVGRWRNNRV